MKKEIGISILLIVVCVVTSIKNPLFLSAVNLENTANLIGLFGVFSLGTGLVIITGGIDLSVGSMCALPGVFLAMALSEWHWPWPLAVLVVLGISMLLGLAHGLLITRAKLQPFIVTLCGLLIYRGAARYIADDSTKGFVGAQGIDLLRKLASGRFLVVPASILSFLNVPASVVKFLYVPAPFAILIVLSVVMWFVLHRSIYGRYLLAVGRNEQAARFSGINTRLVTCSAYVIAALFVRCFWNHDRVLHELHFAIESWKFLRTLRHRRGRVVAAACGVGEGSVVLALSVSARRCCWSCKTH